MTLKAVLRALRLVVVNHLPISSVAAAIGATQHVASDAISELSLEVLIDNPTRLEGVRVIGVDECVWWRTPREPCFATVITGLIPVADKTEAVRS